MSIPSSARLANPVKEPDGLTRALLRLLMKRAVVSDNQRLNEHFHLITLESAAFRGIAWTPGQKLQIAMGSAFVTRTYTPIEWDTKAGRTRLLAYAHGDAPGSRWVRGIARGDDCDVFGPRASLDASPFQGLLALFGDETSIGLAIALRRQAKSRACSCYFELTRRDDAVEIVARLGLPGAVVFARNPEQTHLEDLEAALASQAAAGASFVLTGKAGTIQRLRRALKRLEVPNARILTKAYWAPGKTGLD